MKEEAGSRRHRREPEREPHSETRFSQNAGRLEAEGEEGFARCSDGAGGAGEQSEQLPGAGEPREPVCQANRAIAVRFVHEFYESARIAAHPQEAFKRFLDTVGAVNIDAMYSDPNQNRDGPSVSKQYFQEKTMRNMVIAEFGKPSTPQF